MPDLIGEEDSAQRRAVEERKMVTSGDLQLLLVVIGVVRGKEGSSKNKDNHSYGNSNVRK